MNKSKVPPEWQGDPWTMHRQSAYRDLATNVGFPTWLRVTYAAYANMHANGHARFEQRVLGELLGSEVAGQWVPANRRTVHKAIKKAMAQGLLDETSRALCLVVPRTMVAGGRGDVGQSCDRHPTTARRDRRLRGVS